MKNYNVNVMLGPRGAGKDTRCNTLVKEEGYAKFGFADGVRDVAWMTLGWKPETDAEYEEFKKNLVQLKRSLSTEENVHIVGSWILNSITGRQFLIYIGDGFRNYFGPMIWIDGLINKVNSQDNRKVCISDCRYPNEAVYLYASFDNVQFIFCDYRSDRYEVDDTTDSEWLACRLLEMGYKDGDEVEIDVLRMLLTKFEEKNENKN